jgi:hypothetical protein
VRVILEQHHPHRAFVPLLLKLLHATAAAAAAAAGSQGL